MPSQMLVNAQISYPVLGVGRGFLELYDNENGLTRCGEAALRRDSWKGLVLIDRELNSFEVERVRKVGAVGPLGGFRLFHSRLLRIELGLRESGKVALVDLKERLRKLPWIRDRADSTSFVGKLNAASGFDQLYRLLKQS